MTQARRRTSDSVLVMATGGQPRADGVASGDAADEVARHLDDPLVLVGPLIEDRGEWSGIVVFWDGSFASAAAVPVAVAWARGLDLPLHLVHVRTPGSARLSAGVSPGGDPLAGRVVRASTVGGRAPVVVEIVDGDAAAGAARFCRTFPGGALAVTATRGQAGPPARALGPFPLQLVREGPHAVLICHFRV